MQTFKEFILFEEVNISKRKKFFDNLENTPLNDELEELEQTYWGGISDFGDNRAAQAIQNAPDYKNYIKYIHNTAKKILGNEFEVYRLMGEDTVEDMEEGTSIGIISTSLSKNFVKKFKNFAGFKGDKSNLKLVEFKIPYDSIIMRGKPEEQEIVVDSADIDTGLKMKVLE